MLKSHTHVSDLIFSPGRAPQVEVSGQLIELKFKGLESLTPQDTSFLAYDIMGKNETPARKLESDGSADLSYGIAGVARFRVNVFKQRGTCAVVMRVIPDNIPGFTQLNLPDTLQEVVELRNGIVLENRSDWIGKIIHACRDYRQDERSKGLPHPDHRGPYRVSAPPQTLHDSSA